ncbi:MAG TPA: DUF3854 domain-containing protein, partial [Gemmataceae bacterium]
FTDATPENPCKVCGHATKGCRHGRDGLLLCRVLTGDQPGFKGGRPCTGDPQWSTYRAEGDPGPATSSIGRPAPIPAEPEVLDEVYGTILRHLSLTTKHHIALQKRGLKSDLLGRGYRSVPHGRLPGHIVKLLRRQYEDKLLLRVPGFAWVEGLHHRGRRSFEFCCCPGLLIPVRDVQGRIVALKVRRDNATSNKYVYVSSSKYGGPGSGAPPHVPLGAGPKQALVRLTEGELKADIATALDGVPTIASPGTNWQACLPVLKDLEVRTVLLAYDADAAANPQVGKKVAECFDGLQDAGYEVQFERWPAEHGKGIDDVLAAGHQTEVLAGDNAAAAVRGLAGANSGGNHERNGHTVNGDQPPDAGAQAGVGHQAAEGQPFSNFYVEEVAQGERTINVKRGYSAQHMEHQIRSLTDGWPKRVDRLLFVADQSRPHYLEKPSDLFAWIGRQLPASTDNRLQWCSQGASLVPKAEFHAHLQQTGECYDAVEAFPHHPALANHYYLHPPIGGGDGSALRWLLDRFRPDSKLDAELLKAFILTQFTGIPPGTRPAFVLLAADDDEQAGRGVGKTTFVEVTAQLSGGCIGVSEKDSMGEVKTRLLSPAARGMRVILLDNVKSLRFSWAELEAFVTATTVSGRQNYVGEGR